METVLQYLTLMRSSRRDHSNDVSDNIVGCLSGLSCRCFLEIVNFSDGFRQGFKLFYSFGISKKNTQEKQCDEV